MVYYLELVAFDSESLYKGNNKVTGSAANNTNNLLCPNGLCTNWVTFVIISGVRLLAPVCRKNVT